MKKLLILMVIVLGLVYGCKAQDTTLVERVKYLQDDYYDELVNGSLKNSLPKARLMNRANGHLTKMTYAIGEGNTTLAGQELEALNTMFGTSYSLPTFDFDETSQSYLDIDSIKLSGMSVYVSEVIDEDAVLTIIEANPSIDADSVNTLITGALDTVSFSADSSWASITTPIINFSETADISAYPTDAIEITSGGVHGHTFGGYNFYSSLSTGFLITNPSISNIRFMPNQSDDDTGYGWLSSDLLAIMAGGDTIIKFEEYSDSIVVNVSGVLSPDTISTNHYIDSSATAKSWLIGTDEKPTTESAYTLDETGAITEYDLVEVTENSAATIETTSSSPPDISTNTEAYWIDSDNSTLYHIVDVAGTQYYDAMDDTP